MKKWKGSMRLSFSSPWHQQNYILEPQFSFCQLSQHKVVPLPRLTQYELCQSKKEWEWDSLWVYSERVCVCASARVFVPLHVSV